MERNNRIIIGSLIISILFSIMIFKLIYIQIFKHDEYSGLALRQRSTEIEIDSPRGYIFDKNLNPLTNNTTTPTIIVPKNLISKDKLLYSNILKNTSLTYIELQEILAEEKTVLQIPLESSFDTSNFNNVFILEKINRYDPDNILSHVIGYVNKEDNNGESGLENIFNENLKRSRKNSLLLEHDDKKSLFIGATEYVDDTIKPMDPTSVVTTIDIDIQRNIERIMDEKGIDGSIIVADANEGGILATASRPNFKQDEIFKYMDTYDASLYNKSVQVGYPPGSVFKIVVLLAALEYDFEITNREFSCNGYENIENLRIRCSATHNSLNLKEAFSKSCNSTFIQLGKEIGSDRILNMARKLNFGEKINIGLLEEIKGNIPTNEESVGPAIGNISIGQWKIEVTPLQITNLLMTIVNDGIQKPLRLIEGESNDDGHIIKKYNASGENRVINEIHAKLLKEYLVDVVNNGTGKNIKLSELGSAGGKTGSAEAILNEQETVHGWFSGFYPAKNPRYVITVLVEEGVSGSVSAAPIFEEICIGLFKNK